ncbi:MAG TPA: septation protein SepH [Mycobacteriales bacterium]|nr:septation protein SepH [Mycobacteriales bacterium]
MREAKFIGMSADGSSLVVELGGEHILVAADDDLRKALAGDGQMSMPLEARLTPREVQHRIRCGQTAAEIASATGVAIELIARFEGPVLDERRHHAEQAQRAEIDGQTLAERAAEMAGGDVPWDSWLGEDDRWRVRAQLGEHRSATWVWDPRTRRLRALDDVARTIQTGGAAADALDAVLRPVATKQAAEPIRPVEVQAAPEDEPAEPPSPAAAQPAPTERAKKRASVPSWDDIMLGTTSRRPSPAEPDRPADSD